MAGIVDMDPRGAPEISFPKRLYWPFEVRPPHLRTPLLFAYSPNILPRPGDWDEHVHVTGYFFLIDEAYRFIAKLSALTKSFVRH
jgi:hypothetical protein